MAISVIELLADLEWLLDEVLDTGVPLADRRLRFRGRPLPGYDPGGRGHRESTGPHIASEGVRQRRRHHPHLGPRRPRRLLTRRPGR
ncbi:MAG: hypothetical protein ACT4RN_10015 [Pseudonocardia sp.]